MIHIEENLEKGIAAHLVFDDEADASLLLSDLSRLFKNNFEWQSKEPEWALKLSDIYHCCSMDVPVIKNAIESLLEYVDSYSLSDLYITSGDSICKYTYPPEFEISSNASIDLLDLFKKCISD